MTTAAELRAFLDRPWDRLRALKDRHTAALVEREGTGAAFRIAASLQEHAAAMGAVPTPAQRADDLATAVRIRKLLDRANQRLRRDR